MMGAEYDHPGGLCQSSISTFCTTGTAPIRDARSYPSTRFRLIFKIAVITEGGLARHFFD